MCLEVLLNLVDLDPWLFASDPGTERNRFLIILKKEDFNNRSRIHNWRNYIEKEIQEIWPQLSDETRVGIYIIAEKTANNEECWED